MGHQNILVFTDNPFLHREFKDLLRKKDFAETNFDYSCSPSSKRMFSEPIDSGEMAALVIKNSVETIVERYDLIISIHCKQLFPAELVHRVRCINVHPGLNPHNRGWYPQVFSILNKRPHGATIHEIDEELDHGPIVAQKNVEIYPWDTSLSVYERVQIAELCLLEENIDRILLGNYATELPTEEGNINYKADFAELLHLNLKEQTTLGACIDRLRALSHGKYKNAFFTTEMGERVYVSIELQKDESGVA